jgi:lipopolysaccharide transport system permease protein
MPAERLTIIEPRPERLGARLRELWRFRHFYPFVFRELMLRRVRRMLLGSWWLVLRPLIPTAMAVVTFTFVASIDSEGLPYAVFFLSGFLTWNIFHSTLGFAPRSLMWMQGLMRRTYFPRLLVPLAALGPPLIEFAIVIAFFLASLAYFWLQDGVVYLWLSPALLLVPLCIGLALLLAICVGMVFAVIALFVRDVIYSVGYVVQIMMLLTPVIYPLSALSEPFRTIMAVVNPMAMLVETTRWALTGAGAFEPLLFAIACLVLALLVVGCLWLFLRVETALGDMV